MSAPQKGKPTGEGNRSAHVLDQFNSEGGVK
jgi:hypothetical protein